MLESTLNTHLESEQFLWLHVTPQGSASARRCWWTNRERWRRGSRRTASSSSVQARCARRELERSIEAMQANPPSGVHSTATRLWESGLRHIAFRCSDEILGSEDLHLDLATGSATWPEGIAAAEHDEMLHRFEASILASKAGPDLEDWRGRVMLGADDRARLKVLRLDEQQTVVERLAAGCDPEDQDARGARRRSSG